MYKYTLLPILVSLLALAFVDPFMYWYPTTATWLLIGGLMIATSLYGFFVLTEQADDEREESIRSFADRVSCLSGMTLLVLVLIYQTLRDSIAHPEIVIILVVMVTTKLLAHQYACHKH